MDRSFPLRLLLVGILLASPNIICLHGNNPGLKLGLHCVNDCLSIINCSLSVGASTHTSDSNSSFWLTFLRRFYDGTFTCVLANNNGSYFCSVTTSETPDDYDVFMDTDVFEISLCHYRADGSESCKLLENYRPVTNVKPNAPSCLTVSHNSSQHVFTWKSTYEKYSPFFNLMNSLEYQLHLYNRRDKNKEILQKIYTDSLKVSVDDLDLVADTDYAARVRSHPHGGVYKGQWSDWSSEVHWRTESAPGDVPVDVPVSNLSKKILIPLCVTVTFVLVLCCARVQKWRQSAFIPTPAPYFTALYGEFQGDFKSWVDTQANTTDVLKAEETFQIDILIKCPDSQEGACLPQTHLHLLQDITYSNISDPVCDASLLGMPYAGSIDALPSAAGRDKTLSIQPGSNAEEHSGCCLCSSSSIQRKPPCDCNDYCTLSAFEQQSPFPEKCCPAGIIKVVALSEAKTDSMLGQ